MKFINNIITYDINEISSEKLYNDHIIPNIPCVIKNYNKKYKQITKYLDISNNIHKGGYIGINADYHKAFPVDEFIDNIKQKTLFGEAARCWLHKKGNTTPWHYDGNGVEILNMCLAGSKRFYLSKPLSMSVWPMSNIAVRDAIECDTYVDMVKGDMLYLPSFWMHRVVTSVDNTFNINYAFLLPDMNDKISVRDKHIYTLHRMIGSNMCKFSDVPICTVFNKKNYLESFMYGFFEIKWFIIAYVAILSLMANKQPQYINKIVFGLLILSFLLFKSISIQKASLGIINLMFLYIFVTTLILFIARLYNVKTLRI